MTEYNFIYPTKENQVADFEILKYIEFVVYFDLYYWFIFGKKITHTLKLAQSLKDPQDKTKQILTKLIKCSPDTRCQYV